MMRYRWILVFLMLPAIAFGQYEKTGGGSIDTFYIDFCDSNSVASGNDNIDGWLLAGTTLYIDTSEGAGGGEANVLSDTGTYNGSEGFGLAAGKTGVALKVKGLIEGSNITIMLSGDSALVITASGGSGVWTERSDTLFAVDADGDTLAALWDDDAGNVRWQVATEDQTLRLLLDTLGIGGDLISELAGTGLTVVSNELTVDLGTDVDSTEIVVAQLAEYMRDRVGEMLTGTETGISVTPQDGTDDIDFEVNVPVSDSGAASADSAGKAYQVQRDMDGDTVDVSNYLTGNESITLSGDVSGSGATAITTTIEPNAVESTMVGADQINDLDINFGTGTDQVSIVDIPANTWKVIYSNGSGVITELALGADGTYLKSNGASSAPTFATPSGGLWVEGTDTLFVIDSDGDTLAAFWDDDAGNVRWQIATEDQTLRIDADTSVTTAPYRGSIADDSMMTVRGDLYPVKDGETPSTNDIMYIDANDSVTFGPVALGLFDTSYAELTAVNMIITGDVNIADDAVQDSSIPNTITIDEASDVDTTGTKIAAALGNRTDDTEFGKVTDDTTNFIAAYDSLFDWFISPLDETDAHILVANGSGFNNVAMSVDATIDNTGAVTVVDDSHNHVITNIDTFSESDLEIQLSDVTAVFTNNVTGDVTVSGGTSTIGANVVDSTHAADGDFSIDDLNWRYEYIYLEMVHGWGRALEDSSYLDLPIHNGSSSYLFIDYAGDITPTHNDTVFVSGAVPFGCSIDSVTWMFKEVGSGQMSVIDLYGPDVSDGFNMTDSSYYSNGTDREPATWTKYTEDITDIAASAGDRFAVRFVFEFDADSDSMFVGWVRLAVRR